MIPKTPNLIDRRVFNHKGVTVEELKFTVLELPNINVYKLVWVLHPFKDLKIGKTKSLCLDRI